MRHDSAIFHIRIPIIAFISLLPVVDHPFLPGVGIGLASIVVRDFQRVFHAVGVGGAVIGEIQLVALAIVILERVGVFGFCITHTDNSLVSSSLSRSFSPYTRVGKRRDQRGITYYREFRPLFVN